MLRTRVSQNSEVSEYELWGKPGFCTHMPSPFLQLRAAHHPWAPERSLGKRSGVGSGQEQTQEAPGTRTLRCPTAATPAAATRNLALNGTETEIKRDFQEQIGLKNKENQTKNKPEDDIIKK